MKIFKLLLILVSYMLLPGSAMATPYGAYANYEHKGGNVYLFRLVYYKSCTSIPFASTRPARLSSTGCATTVNLTMQRVAVNQNIQKCASVSGCGLLEEVVYELEVDFSSSTYNTFLGSSCCDVVFSASYCCRPSSLSAGANADLYVEASLSLCTTKGLRRGNSSPGRAFALPHYVMQNSTAAFSFFATDRDGDSLAYTLRPARTSASTSISYPTGLSFDKPLTVACGSDCSPAPTANPPRGFFLNAVSGDVVFYPTTANQGSVAVVQLEEFRKDSSGKYHSVGKSLYEHFLQVLPAGTNLPPVFTGSQTVNVCAGDRICFKIRVTDAKTVSQTAADTPALQWFSDAVGASIRIVDTTLREKELEFCWNTSSSDAVKGHYFLSVRANDRNCDVPAYTQRTYRIFVRNKPQSVTRHKKLPGSRLLLDVQNPDTASDIVCFVSGPGIPTLTRKPGDTLRLFQPGIYQVRTVTSQPGRCQFDLIDTFHLSGCVQVKLELPAAQPICRSAAITVTTRVSNNTAGLNYSWRNRQGQLLGNGNRFSFLPLSDTQLRVRVDDTFGCYGMDTLNIATYLPALGFTRPTTFICSESPVADWVVLTNASPANAVFSSGFSNLVTRVGNQYTKPRLVQADRDTSAMVLIRTTDSSGCNNSDSFTIDIRMSPVLQVQNDTFCGQNNRYNLNQRQVNPDAARYTWSYTCFAASAVNPANVVTGNLANINAFGSYRFEVLSQSRSNGCSARDSFHLLSVSPPVVSVKTLPLVCTQGEALDLNTLLTSQLTAPIYNWQAVALDGNRNAPELSAAISAGRSFRSAAAGNWLLRFTESSTRCVRTDSIVLPVFLSPRPNIGSDTSLNIDNLLNLDAGNYASYRWNNNSVDRFRQVDVQGLGLGQHLIWVVVTDLQNGCPGSDSLRLTILPAGTSVADPSALGLRIGPNPFTSYLSLHGEVVQKVDLLSLDGRLLVSAGRMNGSEWRVPTEELSPGFYLLRVRKADVDYSFRVLKTR